MNHSEYKSMLSKARAYSATLDERDEYQRNLRAARMNEQAAQQRAQTIQSMQTKKYELDERKLGFSQPKTQYVSALPILDTVDSVVNPALTQNTPVVQGLKKAVQQYAPAPTLANMGVNNNRLNQSNPLYSRYQSAAPNASLVQQATNNFQQWNTQYKQNEDQYIDAVDRVASLAGWGAPPDEEANRQLEESEAKLNQTKEQEDSMLRQTLTMLGPGAEEIIKAAYKDAIDQPGAGYKVQYTQEETARRAQNQKRAQELRNRIGADLYGKLYNYVHEQDTAAKAARKQREEAEAAAERRHRLEAKYYTLSSVSASKDFAEKSQYRSTAKDSQPSLMTRLIDNAVDGGTSDWDDPLYEAVNGNEEARAYLATKASHIYGAEGGALGSLYGSATEGKQEVKQMTEEQVGVFNYLYATQGKEVAHEYYDLLQELELNPKQRAEEQAYWQQEAEKHQVGSSIFSVAVSPLKVLSAAGQFADYITTGRIDENAGYNSFARIPSTIRGTVAQKVEEKWGPAGSFLYQTGMSMADFLYNSTLTGTLAGKEALGKEAFRLASNMSLAIMGSGAAADATIEAKDRGLTDKQAFVLGTVAGAAEILTEKFSIESLLTGKWEDSAIKFILRNAFVEGSEEVGSDVINMVADVLVAKDKSQWRQSIQAYRNSGLSEEEAFRRAMMDQALEMGLDYLGGALSGGVMAGMQAWGNRGYWQAQQAPRQTGSTDTNQSGFQTNTQVQTPQDVQQNSFEIRQTKQNAPAADITQETQSQAEMQGNRQGPIEPSAYRQTAQQILNENIFESQTYGTAMEETGLTRGEVRQALRDIARGNQSKVADANVQTVLQAIQTVAVNAPAVETSQGQEPIRMQEQQVGPKNSTEEELNRAQLAALEELNAKQNTRVELQETQPGQSVGGKQDQLNGPILAAMNELSGQQANQNAEVQQPGKVPAPGTEAEINNQPAHGVGAAESGYSGDIGTWKRDASEFIKDTELPKQDKYGDTISDSAGSMFKSNVPKETKETIERYAYEGKYSYEKDVNKAQVERVHKAIEQDGFDTVYERTVQQLTNHRASADTTAQAWVLFIQAANRGDSEKAATLSKLIQRYSTSVAQALQANSIYNKLTPEGRLASIQRTVNRINQDIEAQRGKSGSKGGLDGVAEVSVGDGQTVETVSQAAINDAYETSLDLIRNIYKAFSENRNGEKLDFDQWMHKIGETLAKSIKGRTQGKNNMTVSRMIEQDILRFAKDYLPEAAKRKGRTAIDTLTQYYEHKDWYHEAWKSAQDVLTEGSGRKLDNLAVDQTPVMERAIIEAAADQELSKKDIRLQDYLGSRNALASQISAELINQTGATGTDADNIKSACLRYIVEVSEGDGSERKTRNGGTINKAEAQVQADTNKLLKEAGTDIYKILKQHPSDREAVANEIADKLVSKYGLDEKAAQKASQKIVEQFNKMVADKSKSAIEKIIKDSKKEPTPKQRRTLTQALREAANSGMFSQKDSAAIVTRKLFGQEVQIDSALLQEYLSAKGKDQIQAVEDKIYKNIASQMPASLGEKARAWRYMGMLANPKTHINNFTGNSSMYVARKGKDTIKAGLEALFLPQDQRTAAVLPGKERRAAAAADYESVKSMILDGDKYSDSANRKIQESRRIFSNSILEGIRVKNDELLNKSGDGLFAKANYTDAFAGILKARGYTAEDFTKGNIPEAQLDSMRAYAIKEAQKATFRDLNSFSRFVRDIGFKNTEGNAFKKGANVAVEGVLAFKKTPANVLARSVEYSPAGLLDALTRESKQLANGDITASQYLDRVSSGVTGTVLFGFGYLLGHWGLIKGGTSDDDEQDKMEGRQNWAIEIGGKSYTLTFLSPMSMPLYMGAQLEQILDGGAGEGPMMDKVLNVLKGISDPILEMSMMSGLQDALKATDYADNKILAFAANAGLSYLTQYIPTLGGQIKRTFQKPQRTTTFVNEADPVLNKDAQRAIGTATNKIPGPSYQQIPYIDAWGRRQDQGNLATRAFNNLVNPMYVSELKQTDVDREIRRLEKQTGKNYTPSRADNVLTIDGETVILTADEYVTYAESRGQNDFEMRSNLIASSTYKTLDDYTKGKTMEYSKEYADNLAEKEIGLNPPTPTWMEELEGKTAEEVTDALIVHALTAQAGNSKDKDKYNEYADQISSGVPEETVLMALTDNQKENYSKYIQKAKVPAETYLDVLSFESKAKSDDKEAKNSKTKKEKVVAYIDGLKLTKKQKRALYLCFYSEKDDTFK